MLSRFLNMLSSCLWPKITSKNNSEETGLISSEKKWTKTHTINIEIDFSPFPEGKSGTLLSGEIFRKKHLLPALQDNDLVIVEVGNVLGLASSFLEGAFGGLITEDNFTANELLKKLRIVSPVGSDISRSWEYIMRASRGN